MNKKNFKIFAKIFDFQRMQFVELQQFHQILKMLEG